VTDAIKSIVFQTETQVNVLETQRSPLPLS